MLNGWFGHWWVWLRIAEVWIIGAVFVVIVFSFVALGARNDDE
jgi:hypothetical protein